MKKGRPAHTIHALADPATAGTVRARMLAETGSLGVRGTSLTRWPQQRDERSVDVDGHEIRVKVAGQRVKVEHDDAVRAARRTGVPLREVVSLAEAAWRARVGAARDDAPDREPPDAS
jgi:uncharacterized protein (DUF111 family)